MSGVYGDMLLFFPEQRRSITVYSQTAKMNGGWTKNNDDRSVTGIWQHTRPKALKDSNGNTVKSSGLEFWSEEADLGGLFTVLEGDVYRLLSNQPWAFEGGFYRYELDKVVGNDGTESINTSWNVGSHNFG